MNEIRFTLNRKGVHEMLLSRPIQHEMNRRADLIAARAKELALPFTETGDYRENIRTREHPTRNRARAEVVAHSEHSILVEIRHRTMGRAADAAREL